jgi:hypothetical protein
MKKHPLFVLAATAVMVCAAGRPAAAANCLQLGGESYCRVWSASNASMSHTEFLRRGETVRAWQNMVTILRYNDGPNLKATVARYMSSVERFLAPDARPVWLQPKHPKHTGEAATRLLLTAPDNSSSEYVVVDMYADDGKPSYVIVFSQHVPLPSGEIPSTAQYGRWLEDMSAIPAASLAAK